MGDLASDHDAIIELVVGAYRRLEKHDPKHGLLKYVANVSDDGFEGVDKFHDEFLDKFETPDDKKLDYVKAAKVFAAYFVALEKASDGIEGKGAANANPAPVKSLDDACRQVNLPF